MKVSTATASAVLLSNASLIANAFGPSPSFTQRRIQQPQTRLSLLPDPILATSAIESTSIVTSVGGVAETLGSLALLGSVGFGVFSGMKDPDWSYEYKVGNEYSEGGSDLALLGESPTSVLEKVEEETAPEPEVVVKEVPVVEEPEPEPEPAVETVPVVTAEPAKATTPSKELLESTEKAKAVVQKKGVEETKEKISSKSAAPVETPPPAEESKEETSTEVVETKSKMGGRIKKGVTLIVAAGLVGVARNVIKAYLGRGML